MKKLLAVVALALFMVGSLYAQETGPISLSSEKCTVMINSGADLNTAITVMIPSDLKAEYGTYLNAINQKGKQVEIIIDQKLQYAVFLFKNQGSESKTIAEWNTYLNQLQD